MKLKTVACPLPSPDQFLKRGMASLLAPALLLCSFPSQADIPMAPGSDASRVSIRKGTAVNPSEYPEAFYISMKTSQGGETYEQLCTGVLVHPKMVLTAAHCLQGSTIRMVGNGTDLNRLKSRGTIVNVSRKGAHPSYRQRSPGRRSTVMESMQLMAENARFDIAFLTLKEPLNGVPVPTIQVFENKNDLIAQPVRLIGYGMDRYQGLDASTSRMGKKLAGFKQVDQITHSLLIMNQKLHGALPGDSGGPVYLGHEGEKVLIGLLHSFIHGDGGEYLGSTAHLFANETLCWVKRASRIDFMPSLSCEGATGEKVSENLE